MTPDLYEDLRQDEGLRLHAYPDPLSGGEPFTIGYGHTGGITPGTIWTLEQAEAALESDVAKVIDGLDARLPWWRALDDTRQDILVNMAFNMGVEGLLGFHNTLTFIQTGNYRAAADNMLVSAWARQTGGRARRLAMQMRTGVHAGSSAPVVQDAPVEPSPTAPVLLAPEPVRAAPAPPPAPTAPDPAQPDAPTFTPLWKNLATMARDRLASWGGGGMSVGAAALAFVHKLSPFETVVLVLLGVLILLVVLHWGAKKEHRNDDEKRQALATPAPGQPPPALSESDVARIAEAIAAVAIPSTANPTI